MKTTIDIADGVLEEARKVAARDGTTLRALVESGLRRVLSERRRRGFELRDASFGGRGLGPEFRDAGWERIRGEVYRGRGE
jgi:Arc/MetJ family transcription regulator